MQGPKRVCRGQLLPEMHISIYDLVLQPLSSFIFSPAFEVHSWSHSGVSVSRAFPLSVLSPTAHPQTRAFLFIFQRTFQVSFPKRSIFLPLKSPSEVAPSLSPPIRPHNYWLNHFVFSFNFINVVIVVGFLWQNLSFRRQRVFCFIYF